MSAEMKKVDFEAVLQLAFNGATTGDEELLALEAREAFAELIGAARDCMDCELADMACIGSMAPAENALGRLQAALARIGGAA